ncbi:hypothetical protein C2845_PM11G27330 [Panicum miliaceum]|uniref:F-box domain-containing protein n=1 Tax=Panicum miliaceum TaxID=4540 RepID=A0A3L6RTI5_PANMI|nr:hypothetical protein C2845_PM11G27330 [Panicum miliaceum]
MDTGRKTPGSPTRRPASGSKTSGRPEFATRCVGVAWHRIGLGPKLGIRISDRSRPEWRLFLVHAHLKALRVCDDDNAAHSPRCRGRSAAGARARLPVRLPRRTRGKPARRIDDNGTSLPDDALAGVFARLPHTADVVRCAATCALWGRVVATSAAVISRSLPAVGPPPQKNLGAKDDTNIGSCNLSGSQTTLKPHLRECVSPNKQNRGLLSSLVR